ncbi:peroxidase 6-like [Dorcoceras hygrometricum]|uniref:Peroxidase n=1 Tax=Dorcoceras hygrometricum TaxID=472368 RepID=A0A2Z7B4I3_9LAMI|nr:peroxidase 6-like [Dorcoceras hygrometricum]
MASPLLIPLLLLLIPLLPPGEARLTIDYYKKSCPQFSKIVQEVALDKQLAVPTTAAGALRLFFHDCVVGGCDASLLLSSNSFNTAERDHDINKALPGDAFDLITRTKAKLELACPGIVSCSDILAEATRDLVSIIGGPYYPVRLGRKDSFGSQASDVEGHVARANMSMTRIIDIFAAKGFNVREMVTLSGAHTIGFSHCKEFTERIFGSRPDPTLNPEYAKGLKKLCANYKTDETIAAFNDPMSPGKFDNTYYVNLQNGLGLLATDQAMAFDPRTKPVVDLYAANQQAFFDAFAHAMEKVSVLNVKTGKRGEVRRRCDVPNSLHAN